MANGPKVAASSVNRSESMVVRVFFESEGRMMWSVLALPESRSRQRSSCESHLDTRHERSELRRSCVSGFGVRLFRSDVAVYSRTSLLIGSGLLGHDENNVGTEEPKI